MNDEEKAIAKKLLKTIATVSNTATSCGMSLRTQAIRDYEIFIDTVNIRVAIK